MAKRMILMLVVVGACVAGLGVFKMRQLEAMGQAAASFQPPPEAVTTVVAELERWPLTLSVIGTTAAVQGVNVSADLPGIVSSIAFESGGSVRAGDLLVQLDTRQERAQLAAVEAEQELARLNFARLQDLVQEGAIAQAEYDRAAAEEKQTQARVAEIRATIERKTIRAPFSGVLGIRQVHLGQYLSPGTSVVNLQSLDPIYVNFGVPQQQAEQVRIGGLVTIAPGDASSKRFSGRITAKDSKVDETTRNMQMQATISNPNGPLRPGMFVQTEVAIGATRPVVAVPASAISYAPYGDSVFIVTNLKDPKGKTYRGVRQQFVKIDGARGDQVAVISGIKAGEEVVTSGLFKLRNGAAVVVNNKVRPSNNPAAKPENS
ncbi:MAG TPA: efflux RND transporter periplasmic adaptor subunit [Bryobacteraceae bacterium]|jgi:membrane fusion protein (multidrug efflux system)|nr:efflux RND transporter periplasmic adaptor subunit [Bryobacteraceae bacterium]